MTESYYEHGICYGTTKYYIQQDDDNTIYMLGFVFMNAFFTMPCVGEILVVSLGKNLTAK